MRKVGKLDYTGAKRVQTLNDLPSETVVSDAHLADINVIMKAFVDDGRDILDETALQFADVSEFGDYHDVMLNVRAAEQKFMSLPSKVRGIFNHSVEVFLDSAHDADKRAELVAAGYLKAVESGETEVSAGSAGSAPPPAEAEGGSAGAE